MKHILDTDHWSSNIHNRKFDSFHLGDWFLRNLYFKVWYILFPALPILESSYHKFFQDSYKFSSQMDKECIYHCRSMIVYRIWHYKLNIYFAKKYKASIFNFSIAYLAIVNSTI